MYQPLQFAGALIEPVLIVVAPPEPVVAGSVAIAGLGTVGYKYNVPETVPVFIIERVKVVVFCPLVIIAPDPIPDPPIYQPLQFGGVFPLVVIVYELMTPEAAVVET
jgi:hypothetical protein